MKVIIYRQQAHVETHEEDRGLRVRTLQVIKKKIKNRLRGALEEGQTVEMPEKWGRERGKMGENEREGKTTQKNAVKKIPLLLM